MPVEVYFNSHDRNALFELATVERSQPFWFIDRSTKVAQYLITVCRDEQIGAEVHCVDEDHLERNGEEVVTDLSPGTLRTIIYPGYLHKEENIIDFEGERGDLIFQHVTPAGEIQSFN